MGRTLLFFAFPSTNLNKGQIGMSKNRFENVERGEKGSYNNVHVNDDTVACHAPNVLHCIVMD